MTVIDCDAHVEESAEHWSYLDPEFHTQRPFVVQFPEDTIFGAHNAAWVIDYKLRLYGGTPTIMKRASQKGASIGSQELSNIEDRVAAMAESGIDKQVVFPTIFQGPVAEKVELEAALASSWNTHMATQCAKSEGRLYYVAVITFRRPDLAIEELRRVKRLGSCVGIYTHGMEWDMPISNPAFWPIFEEAERLELPIMIHTDVSAGSPTMAHLLEQYVRPGGNKFPQTNPYNAGMSHVLYGFQQFMGSSAMYDFPKLRVAFLEAGVDWVPRLLKGLRERNPKIDDLMGDRVFVACAVDDDLDYVTSKLGDDFLITATDYPHGDAFREDHLADQLAKKGGISASSIDKVLSGNPERLLSF